MRLCASVMSIGTIGNPNPTRDDEKYAEIRPAARDPLHSSTLELICQWIEHESDDAPYHKWGDHFQDRFAFWFSVITTRA